MKRHEEIFKQLQDDVVRQFQLLRDRTSEASVFVLPFKDSYGDNLVIRLRENEKCFILDDGGIASNALFVISETVGGIKANKLVSSLIKSFGARLDQTEGLVEIESGYNEVIPKILHFTKMLITLDTMLVDIAKEEREEEKPERQSLGPRALHKLRKPLKPLIEAGNIKPRYVVAGKAVPDWMVDLAYKPLYPYLARQSELVLFITVDLAVHDPILKSAHAFSRAVDIKAAHENYDIRIAYDRHGQNSTSLNAANLLSEHQADSKAYTAIDLANEQDFVKLVNQVRQENGMKLTV